MNAKLFETMMNHCEHDDLEQLHDILTMLAKTVDTQAKEIAQLKRQMKAVNEAIPSTAVK